MISLYSLFHLLLADIPTQQKKLYIGLGLDLAFNSVNFGIEIDKCLKFWHPKIFGSKISDFYETP